MSSIINEMFSTSNLAGFILGLVSSVVCGIFGWIIKKVLDNIEHKSPFTGYWYTYIFDGDRIVKSDLIYFPKCIISMHIGMSGCK